MYNFLRPICRGMCKKRLSETLKNIKDFRRESVPTNSVFIKAYRIEYERAGVEKYWDLVVERDACEVVLFNATRKKLIGVKQFRAGVFQGVVSDLGVDLNEASTDLGVTVEVCTGINDKDLPWPEIAKEEILEECGYDVPVNRIEEIMTYRTGKLNSVATVKLFYCEVTDDDKKFKGGGVDNEVIEVVEYSIDEALDYLKKGELNSPPSFVIGTLWFLWNKAKKYQS